MIHYEKHYSLKIPPECLCSSENIKTKENVPWNQNYRLKEAKTLRTVTDSAIILTSLYYTMSYALTPPSIVCLPIVRIKRRSRRTELDLCLTLEEESTRLLRGSCRHSEPHGGVRPHGLRPQLGLHLGVEWRHGRLDSYRETNKTANHGGNISCHL